MDVDSFRLVLGRVEAASLMIGVAAAAVLAFGYYASPGAFFPAYLVAYLFWLGISLGCLAIAMIHHLSGGGWGFAIRRIVEAGYSVLPLMAVLFLPLLAGMETLYPWARPGAMEHDEILQSKQQYLNVEFFQYRAIGYFAVWIILALVLNWITSGTNPADEYRRRRRLALLSGPGLVLWVLTVTFASVDWGMSLEPHWYSSMYGVLYMAGQGVSGLALAIITFVGVPALAGPSGATGSASASPVGTSDVASPEEHGQARGTLAPPEGGTPTTPSRQHDLGNLLLAFVLFWSYVSFAQYLIIWSGNLPEETPWYLARKQGGWEVLAVSLMVLHFLVPFLLLLSRQAKLLPRWIVGIASLLLLMRLVDLTWLVMPAFSPGQFSLHWLNVVTPLAIGGFWMYFFAWRLAARAQLPVFDVPSEEEANDLARQPAH